MFDIFLTPGAWAALAALTLLEIVLGIDNIIFISLVSSRLPAEQQKRARSIGLSLALIVRVIMLLGLSWIIGFTEPVLSIFGLDISGRDLVLITGGLFLLAKSTLEIHSKIEGDEVKEMKSRAGKAFANVILQIVLLDIIFSFDSILTAIGMTQELVIMVTAVLFSMIIMWLFAGAISGFIQKHPTLQMLALSFLILIGFMLVLEGIHIDVPKSYIYFAVAFSLGVEALNIRMRKSPE